MNSNAGVITVSLEAGKFHIYCPFHLNDAIRRLPNRRWNKSKGCWVVPPLTRNVEMIDKLLLMRGVDTQISREAREKLEEVKNRINIGATREKFPIWYKFKSKPYGHQREALDYTNSVDTVGYLMDMGTGKSKVFVDRVTLAYQLKAINAVLVVCPSSIRSVWGVQFDSHCPIDHEVFIFGPNKSEKVCDKFLQMETDKLKVLVVAVEGLQTKLKGGKLYEFLQRFLLAHQTEFGIDESHTIKGHNAVRAENCVKLSKLTTRRCIMTGTVMSQGPMDLYMQFEFLNPDIIGIGDFFSFRNRYCEMGGFKNKEIIGYSNLDELTELIKPWVYQCTKSEVLDLPDKVYSSRRVELSTEQRRVYNTMANDSIMKIQNIRGEDLSIIAANVLSEYAMLQEIVGGFVYYKDIEEDIYGKEKKVRHTKELVVPKSNPKIREIMNIAKQNPTSSVIIWARYTYEINAIRSALEDEFGAGVASTYNSESEDYEVEIDNFTSKRTRFFVANQASGSVGLTLNVSDLVVYYSNTLKLNDRVQSEDRNHRIGQVNKVLYIDLVAEGTVDEDILSSIYDKRELVDYVKGKLKNNDIASLFKSDK